MLVFEQKSCHFHTWWLHVCNILLSIMCFEWMSCREFIKKTTNRIFRGENGLHQVLMHCEPWTWSASFLVIPLWMKSYSEHPIRLRTFSKLMWTIFLKNENTTKQFQDNCVLFGVVGYLSISHPHAYISSNTRLLSSYFFWRQLNNHILCRIWSKRIATGTAYTETQTS